MMIKCKDCIDFLNEIDDNSIDLILTDPPYNLGVDDWDMFSNKSEYLKFMYNWLELAIKKLKKTGSLYTFNGPSNSAYIHVFLDNKMLFQNQVIWDKRDGISGAKTKYISGYECIQFFTKSEKYTFNYNAIRIPYESTSRIKHASVKGILKNGKRWYPNPNGKLCNDVWHMSSHRHQHKINGKVVKQAHYTIKPIDMIKRIILASSNKEDKVLDCFLGSGTTAVACKLLDRYFVGCDKNQKYIDVTNQRLKQTIKQCTL